MVSRPAISLLALGTILTFVWVSILASPSWMVQNGSASYIGYIRQTDLNGNLIHSDSLRVKWTITSVTGNEVTISQSETKAGSTNTFADTFSISDRASTNHAGCYSQFWIPANAAVKSIFNLSWNDPSCGPQTNTFRAETQRVQDFGSTHRPVWDLCAYNQTSGVSLCSQRLSYDNQTEILTAFNLTLNFYGILYNSNYNLTSTTVFPTSTPIAPLYGPFLAATLFLPIVNYYSKRRRNLRPRLHFAVWSP